MIEQSRNEASIWLERLVRAFHPDVSFVMILSIQLPVVQHVVMGIGKHINVFVFQLATEDHYVTEYPGAPGQWHKSFSERRSVGYDSANQ